MPDILSDLIVFLFIRSTIALSSIENIEQFLYFQCWITISIFYFFQFQVMSHVVWLKIFELHMIAFLISHLPLLWYIRTFVNTMLCEGKISKLLSGILSQTARWKSLRNQDGSCHFALWSKSEDFMWLRCSKSHFGKLKSKILPCKV
jgi:hypothetical protein